MISTTGGLIAILTLLLWTLSAVVFELVGRRGGSSININLSKCIIATLFISIFLLFVSGSFYPLGANSKTWFWLFLSGLTGFAICDVAMVNAYKMISARLTGIIMTSGPIIAAVLGFFFLDERLSIISVLGILLTISGIVICIVSKDSGSSKKMHIDIPAKGVVLAFIAAVGQGSGLVLSKVGMNFYRDSLDIVSLSESSIYIPLSSTMIRLMTSVAILAIVVCVRKGWSEFFSFCKTKRLIMPTSFAAFFATFLGVVFSLIALNYASAAFVSTILSMVPIVIILPDYILYKRKVNAKQIIGSIVSIAGVAIMFIF